MSSNYQINLNAIARVHSPYKEKFAIPRQPGLVSAGKGYIELLLEGNQQDYVRDIEQHSHLWVIFAFHATQDNGFKALVKAPRLGGNQKTGVLATRSTHRPNPIGMSVVKLDKIELHKNKCYLHISGLDLLDQTPVLDIKPYIPYSDNVSNAYSTMASTAQQHNIKVTFSKEASKQLTPLLLQHPELELFIRQVLEQDPRPAYKKQNKTEQEYGMKLYDLNIRWKITKQLCQVTSISQSQ